jgi:hypothetical protein
MTLAIGMLYVNGVIVAADTQITLPDGRTEDRTKIEAFSAATGTYAIAASSTDTDASDTLVASAKRDIEGIDPKSSIGIETAVKDAMADWYKTYQYHPPEQRPYVQLLVGAAIRRSDKAQDEICLYQCEPPSTMNRKTLTNSGGYVAIGEAKAIANPLYTTLFIGFRNAELASVHVCLERISYLMFRAKKEFRSSVGGDTDVVVLRSGRVEPQWVDIIDMRVAEGFGHNLNAALASTASLVVAEHAPNDPSPAEIMELASNLHVWGLPYKNTQFRVRGTFRTALGSKGVDVS